VLQPSEKPELTPRPTPRAESTAPGEITRVLDDLGRGEDDARGRLLRLVYDEIHRLARAAVRGESPDRTLQATALINEAYLRLFGGAPVHWENRAHFFASAAEVMRRVLIDAARKRKADKRGGGLSRTPLLDDRASITSDPASLLAIDEALQQLAAEDAQRAAIVKLRFFSGLSAEEAAAALGLSLRTLEREWRFARAWLLVRLADQNSGGPPDPIAPDG
jgi:RNA polymerase sigma factor (TIGR02999 family)